jgi:2-dehydro-3-deoxyphosphogluconate aldolase / (4S)-4-hydroxy-2-oxoglutarate aldolase
MLDLLRHSPIVPVFYHADAAHACAVLQDCYDGGVRTFEFTNRGAAALPVFTELARHAATYCPGLQLGIGTILTPAEAEAFIRAGAAFVVQPVTTAAVGEVCRAHGLPWIPAGATLNEIYQATLLGAEVVKAFPGNVLGPGFVKAVLGPMPLLKLMVTGGVEPTAASLTAWFGVGATAVGIGSQLFAADAALAGGLRDRVAGLLASIAPFLPKSL